MTDFSTSILSTGSTAVVRVAGEIDLATAPDLETVVSACLANHQHVDLDLRDVTFMACAGVNALISCRSRAAAAGAALAVVRPSAAVERIVHVARVSWLLDPFVPSEALQGAS